MGVRTAGALSPPEHLQTPRPVPSATALCTGPDWPWARPALLCPCLSSALSPLIPSLQVPQELPWGEGGLTPGSLHTPGRPLSV